MFPLTPLPLVIILVIIQLTMHTVPCQEGKTWNVRWLIMLTKLHAWTDYRFCHRSRDLTSVHSTHFFTTHLHFNILYCKISAFIENKCSNLLFHIRFITRTWMNKNSTMWFTNRKSRKRNVTWLFCSPRMQMLLSRLLLNWDKYGDHRRCFLRKFSFASLSITQNRKLIDSEFIRKFTLVNTENHCSCRHQHHAFKVSYETDIHYYFF